MKVNQFLKLLPICLLLLACHAKSPDNVQTSAAPQSEANKSQVVLSPRFVLYSTENIFTLLLLDTQTGRLWQVQYATNNKSFRGIIPISTDILAIGNDGRFALTKTDNMWTFILTDTQSGKLWQCQFGFKDDDRFCIVLNADVQN